MAESPAVVAAVEAAASLTGSLQLCVAAAGTGTLGPVVAMAAEQWDMVLGVNLTDADVTKKFAYMPILLKSIETAQPRPVAVKYGDVTLAIQDSAYSALQGQTTSDAALSELQTKLEGLIK